MRRRRRWLMLLAILLALGVAGSLLVRHFTRPELLARLLVEQLQQRTGLHLSMGETPDIRLLPRLSLELHAIEVSLPGGETLLAADSLRMALPWRALREPVVPLDRLEVQAVRIDLDSLWQLGTQGESEGPPAPLRLPPFASHVLLTDARIESPQQGFALEQLRIESAPLLDATAWRLNARGRFRAAGTDRAFQFDLATLPRHTQSGLRLGDLSASLELEGDSTLRAQLAGVLELAPPLTMGETVLKLSRWPRELPDLPGSTLDALAPVELALRWTAHGLGPGTAAFRLTRDEVQLDGDVAFGDVFAWLTAGSIDVGPGTQGTLPPAPPLRGTLRMSRIVLDDIELEGVEVSLQDREKESSQ